jgi:hypothetical protein
MTMIKITEPLTQKHLLKKRSIKYSDKSMLNSILFKIAKCAKKKIMPPIEKMNHSGFNIADLKNSWPITMEKTQSLKSCHYSNNAQQVIKFVIKFRVLLMELETLCNGLTERNSSLSKIQ